jgi:tetratricopeptide (TPR) repeat protein
MPRRFACLSRKSPWGILAFLGLWALCAVPARGQTAVTLRGRVRTDKGQTIPVGVTVRLEIADGLLVGEQPANSNGDFEFDGLRRIAYHLIVSAEGFEPTQKDLDLSQAVNIVFVDLYLSPVMKIRLPPAASLPTLTDQRAPKKARKEYEKGRTALDAKNLALAEAHFRKAVAAYPCYARAQADLAAALSAQQDAPRAEAALNKAIQCDPDFLDSYSLLGQLLNAEKRFAESQKVLAQGLRRSPSAWQFYYELAAAHFGLGEYRAAEEDYLKAQSLNPSPPPELHVRLADLYLKLNAYAKAYAQMQDYLRAEPNGRFAAKVKGIMQQMQSSGALRAPAAKATQPPP